jgi:hypothetical protein
MESRFRSRRDNGCSRASCGLIIGRATSTSEQHGFVLIGWPRLERCRHSQIVGESRALAAGQLIHAAALRSLKMWAGFEKGLCIQNVRS